jgi:hypothetical protein
MDVAVSLKSLNLNQRRLVRLMQELNFARIENLTVRAGSPSFDPPPRIVREVKFGGENGPRPERTSADFPLKTQVTDLLKQIEQLGDGTIECLTIKHGLPFSMHVEAAAAA